MLYFIAGVVVGVFLPVQYNTFIKDKIISAWKWATAPKQ